MSVWRSLVGLVLALMLAAAGPARAEEGSLPALDRLETAHYHVDFGPGQSASARRLVAGLEGWHARIHGELGVEVREQARIIIGADERDMFALVQRFTPGAHPPEWAAGLAFPALRVIYLRADVPPDELERTAQHELSHLALGTVLGGGRAPIWFSEGMAIRQSEPFAAERLWLLTEAALSDRLLPLSELDKGYPHGAGRVGVGYAQSVHFVGYLVSKHGEARLQALLKRLSARDASFEVALGEVYGKPLATIEREWRESLTFWWGWIPVAFIGASFWVLAGLLLVAAWRRRRREQASRMLELAGLEAVDMAEDVEIAHNLPPARDAHDPYHGRPPSIH